MTGAELSAELERVPIPRLAEGPKESAQESAGEPKAAEDQQDQQDQDGYLHAPIVAGDQSARIDGIERA